MNPVVRFCCREGIIILALWAGSWLLFFSGVVGLKSQKEHYWTAEISSQKHYQELSLSEREKAHSQFMGLWAVKPGDQPFRNGSWTMTLAYGAQLVGAWLRAGWFFLYFLSVLFRLGMAIRRTMPEKPAAREGRLLGIFLVLAALWYLTWAFLVPSGYYFYERFVLGSYDYLWNARLSDFEALSKFWPLFILFYLVTAVVRGFRRLVRGNPR